MTSSENTNNCPHCENGIIYVSGYTDTPAYPCPHCADGAEHEPRYDAWLELEGERIAQDDDCPHCHMGAVVDWVEYEYIDCPHCQGSGYRDGTTSARDYWKRRAADAVAVEELEF